MCEVKLQGGGIPKIKGLGGVNSQIQPHVLAMFSTLQIHPL